MISSWRRNPHRGASLLDYGLIAVVLIIVCIPVISALGGIAGSPFGEATSALNGEEVAEAPPATPTPTAVVTASPTPSPTPIPTPTPTPTPAPYEVAVLALDPVAYWRLGEASGSSAADASGNGRTGTYIGAPTLGAAGAVATDSNTAVGFNGSTQYVSVSATGIGTGSAARTVTGFVNPSGGGGSIVALNTASGQKFIVQAGESGRNWYLFTDGVNGGNNVTLTPAERPPLNSWSHFAFVLTDSTNWKYYLNGILIKSGTFPVPINTPALTSVNVGQRADLADQSWEGRLDEVAIWNRALSASEIAGMYDTVPPYPPLPPRYSEALLSLNPASYWRLGEASGTSAADASGNGRTGTYIGTPALGAAGAVPGDSNTAVTFNGTTQYVSASASGIGTGSSPRTVAAFVNPIGEGGSILSLNTASGQKFIVQTTLAGGNWYLFTDGVQAVNNVTLTAAERPPLNTWSHVVFVLTDSTNWRYYLNGVLIKSGTFPVPINTSALTGLTLANRTDTAGQSWEGRLDEVAIWNRALSASEIASLYAALVIE